MVDGVGYEVVASKAFGSWKANLGWSVISPDNYMSSNNETSQYELNYITLALNYQIESIGLQFFIEG